MVSPGSDLPDLPGLDRRWSRRVTVPGTGEDPPVTWHLLDNAPDLTGEVRGTLLAVHGNPTWSYLWRSLLPAAAAAGWRVVAVDQLGMGFSQRDGRFRRLADRVAELGDLTDHLGLTGPVVTVGHDWGGVVSLGWAVQHPELLAGVVVTNTAVHHDDDSQIPALLRLAGNPSVHGWATSGTRTFLRATLALAHPPLSREVRAAYLAPYDEDRRAVADFVADIPADPGHPSRPALDAVAAGVARLEVPALVLWGPRDPVFQRRYLEDLLRRLPHADVHRFEGAGHLLAEDVDVAGTIIRWLRSTFPAESALPAESAPPAESALPADSALPARPLAAVLDERREDDAPAVVALHPGGTDTVTWRDLATRVRHLALGLHDAGVRPGQRVSLLVTPGVSLTTALFACLRLGAVAVIADQGLGLRGMSRAIRGASPDVVIGIERGLVGARVLSWPGRRVAVSELPPAQARALGVTDTLPGLTARGAELEGAGTDLPPLPGPDDDAAILFTSGSTGPAKGVVYTHRGLAGMRDTLATTYGLGPDSSFVAGFAPFALLGTAMGSLAVVPDMDVTAPATLTAAALAEAVRAGRATAVFTSPAALRNVLATAGELTAEHREALSGVGLFLSAGAPIPPELLARVAEVMPRASARTPYGMTEVLPVTDIDLAEIRRAVADVGTVAGAGGGTCVGRPVPGTEVTILPLDDDGAATGEPTDAPGVTGEILVAAPHLKRTYDRLWATQQASADHPGRHRTGDVGHLDAEGRLWVEGRLSHIVTAPGGVVTPVAVEHAAERVPGVRRAAAVGVGPAGTQQLVVVLETDPAVDRRARAGASLATPGLTRAVRRAVAEACDVPVAAVLRVRELPTDVRHNAKIERGRIGRWAERALAGGRMGEP
ncbi:Acyl-CoA synthetase (AMP-forming)/AMP-acid ligase II [Georgenia satyanarayanai]|uniref:Acyl-CoA synthetase (AMP-forming)/AMP-acid ligase II n=1 Tax=Georgenia satyanarayanai TaxID=860221 RepID=A0A2Y9AJ69_9MICO|nr:acyl-CoA synthetase (AMP-forming)/AMP-acid ligase II [Georgenia satyanarayanai]SSA43308.1 Acyl-CoA synthetase (AMP-forming)/AMP-acid ligase II [Georgenia satyanarayanai]